MTTNFTYGWMVKVTVVLLGGVGSFCFSLSAQADSALAGASVRIESQPSVIGALAAFQVNISKPKSKAVTVNATPDQGFGANNFLNFNENQQTQPAVFSISGQPAQSFSIVMPQAGVSKTAEGSFEFSGFEHTAGSTPTIGSDGSKVFAVGARVKFTPTAASSAKSDTAPDAQLAKETPAQKDRIPRPNPFGIQGVEDGFLNVLVSYN